MRFLLKAMTAAKRAWLGGLITWPQDSKRSCADCKYADIQEDYCHHKKIDQKLVDGKASMCCNHYESRGMKRHGSR